VKNREMSRSSRSSQASSEGESQTNARVYSTYRFPWLYVGLGMCLLVGGGVALIRFPRSSEINPSAKATNNYVGLGRLNPTDSDDVTREDAMLRDPTPLFLPTEWNAGNLVRPPSLAMGPDTRFQNFPPKLTQPETGLRMAFEPMVTLPLSPAEGLRIGERLDPYGAIGRTDQVIRAIDERFGFVEVIRANDGQQVIAKALTSMPGRTPPEWQPMELLVGISARGLEALTVISSSGIEEWDQFIAAFLKSTLRLGERLPPGFYRVSVGP
jgi:hypothetical protein